MTAVSKAALMVVPRAVLSADVKAVSRVEQLVDSSVGQSAVHWVFQ